MTELARATEDRDTDPRAQATRTALLDAGLRLFSRHGFDAVSTRRLAAEAGVNLAAMGYHFGGKQDFYRAVLQQVIDDTEPFTGVAATRLLDDLAAAGGDREALAAAATRFLGHMVRGFLGDERTRLRAALVVREFAQPSEAFPLLFEGRIKPVHEALATLVAAATGLPADSEQAILRAHALMGQVVMFVLAREVVYRRLDWDHYSSERIEKVRTAVVASVLGSLGLPLTADAEAP